MPGARRQPLSDPGAPMPFEFSIPENFYLLRFYGQLTEQDLRQVMVRVLEAERLTATSPNRIIDTTGIDDYKIDLSAIDSFSRQRKASPPKNPIKIAVIVQRPVDTGITRMFEAMSDHPSITIRIVRHQDEAKAWFAREGDAQN